jgi:hypothetical protein
MKIDLKCNQEFYIQAVIGILIASNGCIDTPIRPVTLKADSELTIRETQLNAIALFGWDSLGFGESKDGIEITIHLMNNNCIDTAAGCANISTSEIWIDETYSELEVIAIIKHELGHVLLHTPHHLPFGEIGVMAATCCINDLTKADYKFACDEAGICN